MITPISRMRLSSWRAVALVSQSPWRTNRRAASGSRSSTTCIAGDLGERRGHCSRSRLGGRERQRRQAANRPSTVERGLQRNRAVSGVELRDCVRLEVQRFDDLEEVRGGEGVALVLVGVVDESENARFVVDCRRFVERLAVAIDEFNERASAVTR